MAPSGEIPALPSSGGAHQDKIPLHEPELTDLMFGFTGTEQDEIQALCAQMEQEEQAHEAYPPLSIGPHAGATGKLSNEWNGDEEAQYRMHGW